MICETFCGSFWGCCEDGMVTSFTLVASCWWRIEFGVIEVSACCSLQLRMMTWLSLLSIIPEIRSVTKIMPWFRSFFQTHHAICEQESGQTIFCRFNFWLSQTDIYYATTLPSAACFTKIPPKFQSAVCLLFVSCIGCCKIMWICGIWRTFPPDIIKTSQYRLSNETSIKRLSWGI